MKQLGSGPGFDSPRVHFWGFFFCFSGSIAAVPFAFVGRNSFRTSLIMNTRRLVATISPLRYTCSMFYNLYSSSQRCRWMCRALGSGITVVLTHGGARLLSFSVCVFFTSAGHPKLLSFHLIIYQTPSLATSQKMTCFLDLCTDIRLVIYKYLPKRTLRPYCPIRTASDTKTQSLPLASSWSIVFCIKK
jgi:hypothetical protein